MKGCSWWTPDRDIAHGGLPPPDSSNSSAAAQSRELAMPMGAPQMGSLLPWLSFRGGVRAVENLAKML